MIHTDQMPSNNYHTVDANKKEINKNSYNLLSYFKRKMNIFKNKNKNDINNTIYMRHIQHGDNKNIDTSSYKELTKEKEEKYKKKGYNMKDYEKMDSHHIDSIKKKKKEKKKKKNEKNGNCNDNSNELVQTKVDVYLDSTTHECTKIYSNGNDEEEEKKKEQNI
ncbi:hypothetical protein PFTANZ_00913 [Plasmodium falciparum Tanzania (2000708)]|uniref:Uncharacterized protein n=1 Tax=Plasmodium falciparum Tanzania (2000708) TaxID=1036725 RepID=A0A024WDD9_PLAFA|nr:hypothetical protein PFTANZ_00913 [Plasmodium falciparum Tanzania (2000708)]